MNKIFLTGRLTSDPKSGQTGSGVAYTAFRVAVDRKFSDGGEKKADFFDCIAWRKTAEFIAAHFQKGKAITIVGELQTNSFKGQDGQTRTKYEVVALEVEFAMGNGGGQAQQKSAPKPQQQSEPAGVTSGEEGGDFDPWAEIG